MSRRILLIILIVPVCLLTSGCPKEYRLKDLEGPKQINHGLHYVHWRNKDTQRQPANTLKILKGMKLTFNYVPLRTQGENDIVPGPSSFSWIVPGSDYTPHDFFFLNYMLATGQTANNDATKSFQDLGNKIISDKPGISDKDFYDQLAKLSLGETFESLRLESSRTGVPSAAPDTAAEIREWFTRPGKDDFKIVEPLNPQQSLTAKFPGRPPFTIRFFSLSPAFFNSTQLKASNPKIFKNKWYEEQINTAFGHIEIEVPVRVSRELSSRYLPFYWSIHDLEARLGVDVVGIRRKKEFLNNVEVNKSKLIPDCAQTVYDPKNLCGKVVAPDNYFTLWFTKQRQAFGAKGYLQIKSDAKYTLMVAPGDVIILSGQRKSPTDSPEMQSAPPPAATPTLTPEW